MMTGATMGKSSKQLCNIYIFYIPHNILMFLIFVSLKKKREKNIHQAYKRTLNKGKFIRYQLFFVIYWHLLRGLNSRLAPEHPSLPEITATPWPTSSYHKPA